MHPGDGDPGRPGHENSREHRGDRVRPPVLPPRPWHSDARGDRTSLRHEPGEVRRRDRPLPPDLHDDSRERRLRGSPQAVDRRSGALPDFRDEKGSRRPAGSSGAGQKAVGMHPQTPLLLRQAL
jgi:hypothetical protein